MGVTSMVRVTETPNEGTNTMFNTYSTVAPVAHVAKAQAVQVIHTYRNLQNPEQVARLFSIHLSVDKGYSNTMVVTRKGWRVICDEDQRAVDFNRN